MDEKKVKGRKVKKEKPKFVINPETLRTPMGTSFVEHLQALARSSRYKEEYKKVAADYNGHKAEPILGWIPPFAEEFCRRYMLRSPLDPAYIRKEVIPAIIKNPDETRMYFAPPVISIMTSEYIKKTYGKNMGTHLGLIIDFSQPMKLIIQYLKARRLEFECPAKKKIRARDHNEIWTVYDECTKPKGMNSLLRKYDPITVITLKHLGLRAIPEMGSDEMEEYDKERKKVARHYKRAEAIIQLVDQDT